VSGFSAEWLALREPFDMQARSKDVLAAVARAFAGRDSLVIVDLGSGTGSTVRALSARLPVPQAWRLVDNDPVLLAEAFAMRQPAGVAIETAQFDLNDELGPLLDGADFVTTSALLDLVSEPWLANLAAAIAARSLPFYAGLTYDGRTKFSSFDPIDAVVMSAFHAHQLRNKGFGPALGSRAPAFACGIFQAFGYSVVEGQADWVAKTADGNFQLELLAGWKHAAGETGAVAEEQLAGWFARRSDAARSGAQTINVGHVDFFAEPRRR